MAGLAETIAAELGDRVRLSSPVRHIRWRDDGVVVETPAGAVSAKRAILALPPNQAMGIDWDPILPASKSGLWLRMPPGACIKCVAQYETPFWREQGLAGQAVAPQLDVRVIFDNTEAGKRAGLLLGFIEGDQARLWAARDTDDRRAAVLEAFAACYGEQARHPIDYVDQDWTSELWSRGCYAALMGPGVWTGHGRHLRTALGPVHMAGTETATAYYGYFQGALEAAERAAGEVRTALGVR